MTTPPAYADAVIAGLEAASDKGDPAPVVYRRLFEAHPELQSLFVLGDAAKGHMLDEAFRVILDFLDGQTYGAAFLSCEQVNHEQIGVPPELYRRFFPVVRDGLQELAGAAWTPAMEGGWRTLLADLDAAIVSGPTP